MKSLNDMIADFQAGKSYHILPAFLDVFFKVHSIPKICLRRKKVTVGLLKKSRFFNIL
jgi:hypothetical protein